MNRSAIAEWSLRLILPLILLSPGYASYQSSGRGGPAPSPNLNNPPERNSYRPGAVPLVGSAGVASFEDLCKQADLVVEVFIESLYPPYLTGDTAHTDSVLRIESTWKGQVDSKKVIASQLGTSV